jgi:hypothetical protein
MDLHRTLSIIVDLLQALEDQTAALDIVILCRRLRRYHSGIASIAIDLARRAEEDGR